MPLQKLQVDMYMPRLRFSFRFLQFSISAVELCFMLCLCIMVQSLQASLPLYGRGVLVWKVDRVVAYVLF